ncbi:iron (metal) dependent repressor, DtxR family [Desulfurobacterium thermolithotrophum DSM 11699]|uniref:Transcriptional regulator MntR n=1 Tax=Desulfurobacterium thermolithotrophum (strain DSM 11699 / BSA) TaxID=868864 RepID=F0S1R1_DESTD|nr:metal-dependent transcriptional regulator [Desulfurobacterium thermolithotrophum]ADY72916.1 iron (metal) dependent repressor, DtxR family [Desulfurobacterium thermolithotrophum DSM 11699]
MTNEKLAPRLEDYLETIYLLEKKNGVARVKEIANERSVKMPTVTDVLRRLSERGYILYEPYGYVRTTEKGREYAENLYKKHEVLKDFMKTVLQLPPEIAEKEGCLMEHHLSKETVRKIQKLVDFFREKGLSEEFKEFLWKG